MAVLVKGRRVAVVGVALAGGAAGVTVLAGGPAVPGGSGFLAGLIREHQTVNYY